MLGITSAVLGWGELRAPCRRGGQGEEGKLLTQSQAKQMRDPPPPAPGCHSSSKGQDVRLNSKANSRRTPGWRGCLCSPAAVTLAVGRTPQDRVSWDLVSVPTGLLFAGLGPWRPSDAFLTDCVATGGEGQVGSEEHS